MYPRILGPFHGVVSVATWVALVAGCGTDEPAAANPSSTAGAGGQLAAAGTSAAGAGSPAAGGGGAAPSSGAAAAAGSGMAAAGSAAAGTAAPGGMGGASGAAAGMGAPGAAGQPAPGVPRPTECNGMMLPPRAVGKNPPFAIGPEAAGLAPYWPTQGWQAEMPEKLGFDPAKLMAAAEFSTSISNTQAVLVIRHGYIAHEQYFGGFTMSSTHESYSMAKSITSGLIGIAIGEGKLMGTDAKICEFYPMSWDCADTSDPRSRITIEHAMNLSTGLAWQENWRSNASGTNDALTLSFRGVDAVLSREAVDEPGTTKRYSTGDPALLTGVLQQATGMTAYEYGKQKVFDVIGASSIRWNSDGSGRTTTFAGLQANTRDYAKYGYLYLNRGMWDGMQIVPADWIERTTQASKPCEDWNQWLWHVNAPIRLGTQPSDCTAFYCTPTDIADLPPDAYFAEGISGQFIFIIPSEDMVIVRLGMDGGGSEDWDEYARGFLTAILDALE